MTPDDVASRVLRLCLEVKPLSTSGNHLPFLLIMHFVMVMRNVVHPHTEAETTALADYLREQSRGMKKISVATQWLAQAMGVNVAELDSRARITVRHGLVSLCLAAVPLALREVLRALEYMRRSRRLAYSQLRGDCANSTLWCSYAWSAVCFVCSASSATCSRRDTSKSSRGS